MLTYRPEPTHFLWETLSMTMTYEKNLEKISQNHLELMEILDKIDCPETPAETLQNE